MNKLINTASYKEWLIPFFLNSLLLLTGALQSQAAWSADETAIRASLKDQREIFKSAHDALQARDKVTYLKKYEQLGDYPIKHHLEALELLQRIYSFPKNDVRKFLNQNDKSAVASDVRHYWLEALRKHNKWQDYLLDYKKSGASIKQQCYYQFARIKKGGDEEKVAMQDGIKLWSKAKSQPKECDKLFSILIKDKHITEDIAWQRYVKSISRHQYQLSQYLLRFINNKANKELALKLYEIYRYQNGLDNYNTFSSKEKSFGKAEVYEAISYGLKKLAKKDSLDALRHFEIYQKTYNFSALQKIKINDALVKGLFRQNQQKKSDLYLKENIDLSSSKLLEWRVRQSIRIGDWEKALFWINNMPSDLKNKQVWRYWIQRASELNDVDSKLVPQKNYSKLSSERSFYGFLSSQWLGLRNNMNYEDSTPRKIDFSYVERLPGIARTRELLHHNLNLSARREWNKATKNFTKAQWISAAHVCKKWLWHNGAITSMIKAGFWNDTELRFPLSFEELFEKNSKINQIPKHLLIALARQESAFHVEATSPVGAKGLMQLMPRTAKQVASKNNIIFDIDDGLYDPKINIALGSLYFGEMLKRFDGNRILAIASYNAGPTRVRRWEKQTKGEIPFDAWIESIPFNETRNYVQNVLAFAVIYAKKLGASEQMINEQEKIKKL